VNHTDRTGREWYSWNCYQFFTTEPEGLHAVCEPGPYYGGTNPSPYGGGVGPAHSAEEVLLMQPAPMQLGRFGRFEDTDQFDRAAAVIAHVRSTFQKHESCRNLFIKGYQRDPYGIMESGSVSSGPGALNANNVSSGLKQAIGETLRNPSKRAITVENKTWLMPSFFDPTWSIELQATALIHELLHQASNGNDVLDGENNDETNTQIAVACRTGSLPRTQ
jgi:hypothetical protein